MIGIAIGLVMRRFLRWLFGAPFEELPPEIEAIFLLSMRLDKIYPKKGKIE